MREITRIHLAQSPYEIEIDARKILQKYLADVEKSLQADADTMREIEARIVELLIEQGVTSEKVITTYDIEAIKGKLGEPGAFVDETEIETNVNSSQKQLMRDTEDGMLGGVLAGIAAYYDVNVMWLRLAAIILGLVSFGTAFVVYIILWIIMPATKTVADRLQLKGEPVTLESIKQHVGSTIDFNQKTKPLVKVMQVLLGIGWSALALLSLSALVFGTVAIVGPGTSVIVTSGALQDAANVSTWLIVSFVALILCGVLAVIFCSVAAYASFAWKMNKKIAISLIGLAVTGIILFSGVIGAGLYGRYGYDQYVKANTVNKTVAIDGKLEGVNTLLVESKQTPVIYKVTNETPRIEIDAVNLDGIAPIVTINKNDNKAVVKVDSGRIKDCEQYAIFCTDSARVTIYGPELVSLETAHDVSASYDMVTQDQLNVKVGQNSTFDITGGTVNRLSINSGAGARVDAQSVAVTNVDLVSQHDSVFRFANIGILNIDSPNVCSADGAVSIDVQSAQKILHGGKEMKQSASTNSDCLLLTGYGDTKSESFGE